MIRLNTHSISYDGPLLVFTAFLLAFGTAGCGSDSQTSDDSTTGIDIFVSVDITADIAISDSDNVGQETDGADLEPDASALTQPAEWTLDSSVPPLAIAAKKMNRFSGYVDPTTGHNLYFCGEKGIFRTRNSAREWRDVDLQTSDTINFCHALEDDLLSAVGEAGKVWKWSGAGWSSHDLVQNGAGLRGVWMTDATTLRVVGVAGTIFRLDGQAWTDESLTGEVGTVEGIWGADAGELFATGDDLLLHFDDGTWVREDLPDSAPFGGRAIWGSDADNVWAVGSAGKVAFRGGDGQWAIQDAEWFGSPFVAVGGKGTDSVFALALKGMVREFDGSAWNVVELITPKKTPKPNSQNWPPQLAVPIQQSLDYVGSYVVNENEIYIFTSDGLLVTYGDDYVL
ncbi:MAG: hypothetical protein ACI9OJ_003112 [Myxococcota bacterium]|jgi:hypothetical protein